MRIRTRVGAGFGFESGSLEELDNNLLHQNHLEQEELLVLSTQVSVKGTQQNSHERDPWHKFFILQLYSDRFRPSLVKGGSEKVRK